MTSNAKHVLERAGNSLMGQLLDQRFGDGSINLVGSEQLTILDRGRAEELITEDGLVAT